MIFLFAVLLAAATTAAPPAAASSDAAASVEGLVSRWSFEKDAPGANAVASGPSLRIEKAAIAEGRQGTALAFEDWSLKDYLHPDPGSATRAVLPAEHAGDLGGSYPMKVSAWIYPTADPIYYGGIVERGYGYGASFRLILHRGLRVGGSVGRVVLKSATPIGLNAWHEVTLQADGRKAVLIVDGVEAATADIPSPERPASKDAVVIGERFSGRIDEVSIAR